MRIAYREDVSLGFANTLSWRGSPAPAEALHGFGDLADWLGAEGGLDAETVAGWRDWAEGHADAAEALFRQAISLRESLACLFGAIASGAAAAEADLDALNGALADAPQRARLEPAGAGFVWAAAPIGRNLGALLAPVLWSAGDLLAGRGRARIRQCANEKCLWLFVDESKSGTRRWCDMSSCGNRAKAQRHYRKKVSA